MALIPMHVWIDGTHYGSIKSGKNITMTVAPGIHRVECLLQQPAGPAFPAAQEFTVPAGKKLVVVVTPSLLTGKPSFSAEVD